MTEKCFDEGTIQAFLDGELPTDLLETVARHTSLCANCSLLLHQAEEESAFAFSALDMEFNSLVPTERIRTGLYDAISQIEKPRKSLWTSIFGGGFSFSNPSMVAFASLVLVVGLFTVLFVNRANQNSGDNLAVNNQPNSTAPVINKQPAISEPANSTDEVVTVASNDSQKDSQVVKAPIYRPVVTEQPIIQKAIYKPGKPVVEERNPKAKSPEDTDRRTTNSPVLLGEESYVKTIATLTESVNSRKDTVMRPSERVAFESDLAVVDDAINKMRKEVRRNPKNEAARQVLRSSYQSKIDLLNSVAEKTELMATLR